MSGFGKRAAGGPPSGPPPPKRGPANESLDDLIEEAEDVFDDELPEAYMPDVDGGGDDPEPDLCEAGRNWLRPPPANLQPARDALGGLRGRDERRCRAT